MCQEEETGRWVLTGVVAGGYGCSDPSSPALYVRVGRFRSWIDEVTGAHGRPEEARNRPTHADGDLSRREEHVHGKHKETSEVERARLHAHQPPRVKAHHAEGGDKNKQVA